MSHVKLISICRKKWFVTSRFPRQYIMYSYYSYEKWTLKFMNEFNNFANYFWNIIKSFFNRVLQRNKKDKNAKTLLSRGICHKNHFHGFSYYKILFMDGIWSCGWTFVHAVVTWVSGLALSQIWKLSGWNFVSSQGYYQLWGQLLKDK